MTYQEALTLIESEFETRKASDHADAVKVPRSYNGSTLFAVYLYQGDTLMLTDLGVTKDIFDEVEEEEWSAFCKEKGFRFAHWRIERDFHSLNDLYAFIDFLEEISDILSC